MDDRSCAPRGCSLRAANLDGLKVIADYRRRLRVLSMVRVLVLAFLSFWGGLLVWHLTRPQIAVDTILLLAIVGSGMILVEVKIRGYIHRKLKGIRTEAARKALELDPRLQWAETREVLVEFLIGPDLGKLRGRPWEKRLKEILGQILRQIGSSSDGPGVWKKSIAIWLWLLETARIRWKAQRCPPGLEGELEGIFSGLRDEEVLDTLLGSIIAISALFRVHMVLWGRSQNPWTRKNLAKIRGEWIPFCSMRPTSRMFPPSVPDEIRTALYETPHLLEARSSCRQLVSFLNQIRDKGQ